MFLEEHFFLAWDKLHKLFGTKTFVFALFSKNFSIRDDGFWIDTHRKQPNKIGGTQGFCEKKCF